ncbi:MAG: polysaccharide export protein [Parvularculaceae bacterium]|nr:polysaccharide export protein [Parvularculaceae bacterium]
MANQGPEPSAAPVVATSTTTKIAPRSEYLLGPGDKIRLIVYQEPTLSGEFEVNSAGKLSLPLLGEINARGETVGAIAASVSASLSNGYVRDARVAAEVIVYRPFYILGEVTKPGEYPYGAQEVSVLKAVATAGGFTYRAKRSFVYIKRADKDVEERFRLTPDLKVQPGDVVRVAERFF